MAIDNSSSAEQLAQTTALVSRAYQIEMFEYAMQENTIVAMDTGSGKTQIAKMRIEAELERSSQKRIWFCAPSVVLAQQQHVFLSSHLPAYQTRLITGLDNAQFWSTQTIWDNVLDAINIVVSTPQVLLDALSHGFLSLEQVSLLVFDEAHHCIGNEPMAMIMQRFYHPLNSNGEALERPHILGLTASSITSRVSQLVELEKNMDSVCRSPTVQMDDYRQHVNLPDIERLPFKCSTALLAGITSALRHTTDTLTLAEDPTVKFLLSKQNKTLAQHQKLEQILKDHRTTVMKQMKSFFGHAEHIYENIGSWAAELYVRTCISRLHEAVVLHEQIVPSLADREQQYIDAKLQTTLQSARIVQHELPLRDQIAPKTQALISYLLQVYRPGITAIIFVKRRSVAFALTQVLQASPSMKDYEIFSFVGCSNPAHRTLVDLADMQLQNEAFADFRNGRRNICVATQVMEEGVDVQATNLVVRFDEPENFRSFVQSRGRARRKDSKFVMVCPEDEMSSVKKVAKWQQLEDVMKQQQSDLRSTLLAQEAVENEDEKGNEFYRVAGTGAMLTYDNARQHLEHFCTTLPWEDNSEPARPIFIVSGAPLQPKSATVILPHSLPPLFQTTSSARTWRTEKMAKNDAAFQVYRRLHTSKVINDNLLPFPRAKKADDKFDTRDSMYEVRNSIDPWSILTERSSKKPSLPHKVEVWGEDFAFPDVVLLLPAALDCELIFKLESDFTGPMMVKVSSIPGATGIDFELAERITRFLFMKVLGRRLKRIRPDEPLPYFVIPSSALTDPVTWFETAQHTVPLSTMTFNQSLERASYLLGHAQEEVLYQWSPAFDGQAAKQYLPDETIVADRLSKQLSFFSNKLQVENVKQVPPNRLLKVEDCSIQGLSPSYGNFMLLMPSISFMLTSALQGQLAKEGPLAVIGLSGSELVTKALISSSASADHNYEALEFVGDSLLKYYASIQVFFQYLDLTEGGLTTKYAMIVNNARLQRVTKDLGLDAYISIEGFSGYKWTLAAPDNRADTRQMSSKTLADVVEALIGAAYLDKRNGPTMDEMPLRALSHMFPEVPWKSPSTHIDEFCRSPSLSKVQLASLDSVETMLGYQFKYKSLLAEALTRTTLRVGTQSFQRLEFLGDAILDRIVNVALYQSGFGLDPEHLKYRRDALVNRWTLGFLAMETTHQVVTNNVTTTSSGHSTISPTTKTVRLVDHMRTISDRAEQHQRQRAETTFLNSRQEIMTAFHSSKQFPWILLHSVDMSKSYSDIIESIVGAVFIDSAGSLAACERVLEKLGLLGLLRRLTTERDIDACQPIVRLRLARLDVVVREKGAGREKDGSRRWKCEVLIGDRVVAGVWSDVSYKHAEALAAEEALGRLNMGDGGLGGLLAKGDGDDGRSDAMSVD